MPAIVAPTPPANLCNGEIMLMYAPRSSGSGIAVVKADPGIILLMIKNIITTYVMSTNINGLAQKFE